MNQYAEILRNTAEEIRAQDILGWGNACEFAADEIERLERQLTAALQGASRADSYHASVTHVDGEADGH